MPIPRNPRPPSPNHFLAALPRQVYARMLPHLEVVTLTFKQVLSEPGEDIQHVYFPSKGVICTIAILADERITDVGTTGNEGMVGLSQFLGTGLGTNRIMCQVAGDAQRMTAAAFHAEADRHGTLHDLLLRYTSAVLFRTQQWVACTAHHTIAQRCARWLLMTHDRMTADRFPLTQEMLASMLCVRRLSVSGAASDFQQRGLIWYSRGAVIIRDRTGLEGASCECYQRVKDEFERLYN